MIRTERLVLEHVSNAHVDDLIAAIERSLDELKPWMAWTAGWEPAQSREFLAARREEDHLFAILLRDGVAIGVVDVLVAKPLLGTGELGYWMSSEHAGRGYMTEALDGFITWAFDELGVHRLELRAGVDNIASNRVAEKLGFDNRGTMREAARGVNDYYDCNLWELVVGDQRPPISPRPENA